MLIKDLKNGIVVNKDNIEYALAEIEELGIKWNSGWTATAWNPYVNEGHSIDNSAISLEVVDWNLFWNGIDEHDLEVLKKYQTPILIENFEDLKKFDGAKSGRWITEWDKDFEALFIKTVDGAIVGVVEDDKHFDGCRYILKDLGFGVRFKED